MASMKLIIILLSAFVSLVSIAAPPEVEKQAGYLREILQQADAAYHNKHDSIMADAAYDALRAQYAQLFADYPELGAYRAVGAEPEEDSETIEHTRPVLSLQKAYDDEAVEKFIQKCGTNEHYRIEPKIDGLTVVLRYHNGLLNEAITRGDGKTGMDVTDALLASGCVPFKLNQNIQTLEVRGEIYIPHSAFEALNKRRLADGDKPLKSPRNTAAGTLRLDDYAEIARRGIEIQIFQCLETDKLPENHSESLTLVEQAGLPIIGGKTVTASEVITAIETMNQLRPNVPFDTDGLVIKVESHSVFENLGATSHHPRGAIARKYNEIPKSSRLLRVEWSTGETGKLTPVAYFEPIRFSGATVGSATLHNLEHLRALDLMIGDTIQVIRAGGSIPQIIGVEIDRRNGNESPILAPVSVRK